MMGEFYSGEIVELTEKGIERGLQGRAPTTRGVVHHVVRLGNEFIYVRRDGMKGADKYHVSFWRPVEEVSRG